MKKKSTKTVYQVQVSWGKLASQEASFIHQTSRKLRKGLLDSWNPAWHLVMDSGVPKNSNWLRFSFIWHFLYPKIRICVSQSITKANGLAYFYKEIDVMFIGRTYLSAKICLSFETTVKTKWRTSEVCGLQTKYMLLLPNRCRHLFNWPLHRNVKLISYFALPQIVLTFQLCSFLLVN